MTRGTKMVKQMLLHTCSSLTMLSRVTFVIVPSWPKLVNSLPNILHFTLITGQKVEQTPFIAIKSVISYVSLSSHSTGKGWCLINIYTDLTLFSTTLIGSYDSFGCVKFTSWTSMFNETFREIILSSLGLIKHVYVVINLLLYEHYVTHKVLK